jgi:hypothetical protein
MSGSDEDRHRRWAHPRDPEHLRVDLLEKAGDASWIAAFSSKAPAAAPRRSMKSGNDKLPHAAPAERAEPLLDQLSDDRALGDDYSSYALGETSGRTGQSNEDVPSAQLRVDFEPFPQPQPGGGPGTRDPLAPKGPAPHRIHEVLAALERDRERRRSYQANRRKSEKKRDPDCDGGATLERRPPPSSTVQSEILSNHDRARQLLERYKRENTLLLAKEDVDPSEFAVWLLSLRPFLKTSPWRVYRNAGLAVIQTLPHENVESALTILSEDGRRRAARARQVDRRTLKKEAGTRPTRADRIEYLDFQKLLRLLPKMSRAAAASWLRDWLVAGVSTGLCPVEWPLADLEESQLNGGKPKIWLHVANPAQTYDPQSATYRTLDISEYQDKTVEAIRRMIANSQQWAIEGTIQQRRSQCTQLFYEACDTSFPTRTIKLSLFTLRHQFIANMKSVMDRAEVIAVAGDVGLEDESEHYTKRRAAWNRPDIKDVPVPIEQQVQQAKKYLTLVRDRETVMRLIARRRQQSGEAF